MDNISLSINDLLSHLKEQIYFLKTSCDLFDQGDIIEAKRIATTIRILCHDTKYSKSLLNTLKIKDKIKFHSGVLERNERNPFNYLGLVSIGVGENKTSFEPFLDELPNVKWSFLSFKDWWEELVIIDNVKNQFSRKDLVLNISNKDGGAHVDPILDLPLFQLKNENTSGWSSEANGESYSLKNIEFYSIRQIGHELLKTLEPGYQKKLESDSLFRFTNLQLNGKQPEVDFSKAKRNDKCPCNSGLKFKKCHGK